MRLLFGMLSVAASLPLLGCAAAGEPPSVARSAPTGRIETPAGVLTFELYEDAAPLGAANFRSYVDRRLYDEGSFYRATRNQATSHGACCMTVVQGGRLEEVMRGPPDAIQAAMARPPLPPIPHEASDETGLRNRRGAMAWARGAPGSASSEFFVSVEDNPILDAGGPGHPDGRGYAVFGRITSGLTILDRLTRAPRAQDPGPFAGQILVEPLTITRITLDPRVD